MKKTYSLKKEILFKNNIYDILSIAIDKKFSLEEYALKGQFEISGEYLVRENEKDEFNIKLPYLNYIEDIYDLSNVNVDIDDFYYEIKDSNKLVINIDIFVDGMLEKGDRLTDAELENEELDIERICEIEKEDYKINDYDDEIDKLEKLSDEYIDTNNEKEIILLKEEISNNNGSQMIETKEIFSESLSKDFITYKICIVREGDSIDNIVEKYGVSIDNIKKYNTINDIKIGDKIIIPYERTE